MRPKPRQKNRDALAMLGVVPPPGMMYRIQDLQARGEIAAAQRIILDFLALEFDGPPFRAVLRNGRKVLVPR